MKNVKFKEVPWGLMLLENDCKNCDRMAKCTYKDLLLCFMSNVDSVVSMTKEEAEKLKKE